MNNLDHVLYALFWHIQFAGILFALDRMTVGVAMLLDWKLPSLQARYELYGGIWMLNVFLFPI